MYAKFNKMTFNNYPLRVVNSHTVAPSNYREQCTVYAPEY